MPYKDDRHYIEKVLEGDATAFAALVDKHKDNAFTLALRITGNREEAEEIAMDAFVKVYRSLGSFRNDSKFTPWLYRSYTMSPFRPSGKNNRKQHPWTMTWSKITWPMKCMNMFPHWMSNSSNGSYEGHWNNFPRKTIC